MPSSGFSFTGYGSFKSNYKTDYENVYLELGGDDNNNSSVSESGDNITVTDTDSGDGFASNVDEKDETNDTDLWELEDGDSEGSDSDQ